MSNNQHHLFKRYPQYYEIIVRNQDGSLNNLFRNNGSQTIDHIVGGSGGDDPAWRSKIRSHAAAVNSYGALHLQFEMEYGRIEETQNIVIGPGNVGTVTSAVEGYIFDPVRVAAGSPSVTARNLAKQAFLSRARSAMSPFQGGVFLGELKEAVELIRHPASALFNGITRDYPSAVTKRVKGLKKYRSDHDKRGAKAAGKAISETWLEYSFGWRPLIADVKSAAEALAQFNVQPQTVQRVSSHNRLRTDDGSGYQNTRVTGSYNNLQYSYNVQQWTETDVWVFGGVDISSGLNVESASRLAGLTWSDVVPTVWELIPYSFLVDYFTNVGDIISGATFAYSRLHYWGISTKTKRGVILDGYRWDSTFAGDKGSSDKGKSAAYINTFTREAQPSLIPTLEFSVPGIGSTKWLNIAALAGVKALGRSLRSLF